jgi:hypothetical protein
MPTRGPSTFYIVLTLTLLGLVGCLERHGPDGTYDAWDGEVVAVNDQTLPTGNEDDADFEGAGGKIIVVQPPTPNPNGETPKPDVPRLTKNPPGSMKKEVRLSFRCKAKNQDGELYEVTCSLANRGRQCPSEDSEPLLIELHGQGDAPKVVEAEPVDESSLTADPDSCLKFAIETDGSQPLQVVAPFPSGVQTAELFASPRAQALATNP